jgi:acetyl-CoA C-acetyltransferase
MKTNESIVIVSAARTPMGSFQGELASLTAPQLGAVAIRAALSRAGVRGDCISEAFMGNVLSAGLGQAPARQAVLGAGLPDSVAATTISKVCGSGMKAIMLAYDAIRSGSSDIVVAGGMESMSNAPHLLGDARRGMRLGHTKVMDHMILDGLEDAYDIAPDGLRRSMGSFGEDCARQYQFTREEQNAFAIESVSRANAASKRGAFAWEIVPITLNTKKSHIVIDTDEGPRRVDISKIPNLNPVFAKNGTITAASSSSISDGAAALILMTERRASELGLQPLARIIGCSTHSQAPHMFATAPVGAIQALCNKTGWTVDDVDLFEINEAFAVVAMAAMADLHLPPARVNVNGGACALGHPIGASGARIVVTLLASLKERAATRGIASLCIGGGEACAMAIEAIA